MPQIDAECESYERDQHRQQQSGVLVRTDRGAVEVLVTVPSCHGASIMRGSDVGIAGQEEDRR